MGELIPLFPLGTPLFPGVVLPLQIFEPRYRRLMRDLMALPEADERRFFGVVAIRQGWEVEEVAPAEALYDTSQPGRDDGALDVEWVQAQLVEDVPTIIAMHHPPVPMGLPWLDEIGLPAAYSAALADLLARVGDVVVVQVGHACGVTGLN